MICSMRRTVWTKLKIEHASVGVAPAHPINYQSCFMLQGLYEYVKPAWQSRPRPKVDEEKVKVFGQNVAPRPLNPDENQALVYPVTMEIDGVETPRWAL